MYYASISHMFYTAPTSLTYLQVFDKNCELVHNIGLGTDKPYGLSFFNGNIYVSIYRSNQIIVLENGSIKNRFNLTMCSVTHTGVISLTFDSFRYMANTCYLDNSIILTDYNGNNYLNRKIATSQQPFI
jgi:hypothetical protein